jgi:hypothetical protein
MIRFCCNCKPILCVNTASRGYYFRCSRCAQCGPQDRDLETARRRWNQMVKQPILISRYGIPHKKPHIHVQ